MKKNELMAIIATCMMLFAVCLSASAKDKKTVERGMTKQEVIAILGEPKLTSFDAYGDKWEYEKTANILYGDIKNITVIFDRNGRVVGYNTRLRNINNNNPACPPTPPSYGNGYDTGMNYGYYLSDANFSILYNKVKKASFDDNKYDLIEVASLGCNYSCQQVVRMMKIFSFSDERLKVLKLMAPRIVDVQNAANIYQLFSFDSEKQKAGEILKSCR